MATAERTATGVSSNGDRPRSIDDELYRTRQQLNALLEEITRHRRDKHVVDRHDRRLWLRAGRIVLGDT